jgi:hypothetical protein
MGDVRLNFTGKMKRTGKTPQKEKSFRVTDLWGTLFDLWFLIPILCLMVGAERAGTPRMLGEDFLSLGSAWLLSALLFRTPLPLQPLKIWAFLFLALRPTPEILSLAAALQGLILFAAGFFSRIRLLEAALDRHAFERIRRAVGFYVKGIAVLSLGDVLLRSTGFAIPAAWLNGLSGSSGHLSGTVLPVLLLVIPQIPVTLLNGALSTVRERREEGGLSPEARDRLTGRNMLWWLGCASLVAAALGVLPFCHGSGGLRTYRRYRIQSLLPSLLSGIILIFLGLACRLPGVSLPSAGVSLCFLGAFLAVESARRNREKGRENEEEGVRIERHPLELWILSGGLLSAGMILGLVPLVLVILPVLGGERSTGVRAASAGPADRLLLGDGPGRIALSPGFAPAGLSVRCFPAQLSGVTDSGEQVETALCRQSPASGSPDPGLSSPEDHVSRRARGIPEVFFRSVLLLLFCGMFRSFVFPSRRTIVGLSFLSRYRFSSLVPARAP